MVLCLESMQPSLSSWPWPALRGSSLWRKRSAIICSNLNIWLLCLFRWGSLGWSFCSRPITGEAWSGLTTSRSLTQPPDWRRRHSLFNFLRAKPARELNKFKCDAFSPRFESFFCMWLNLMQVLKVPNDVTTESNSNKGSLQRVQMQTMILNWSTFWKHKMESSIFQRWANGIAVLWLGSNKTTSGLRKIRYCLLHIPCYHFWCNFALSGSLHRCRAPPI